MKTLLERLEGVGVSARQSVVTIEATGNYWNELVGRLRLEGCEVYLVHPKKAHDLRKFYRDHTKTDVIGDSGTFGKFCQGPCHRWSSCSVSKTEYHRNVLK